MVAKISLRMCKGKQVLKKKNLKFDSTFDVNNKCLKQIRLPIALHMGASYS